MPNELGNLTVRIGADTAGFTQGIGQINQQMRLLQSRLEASQSSLTGTENSFRRLRETAISLSQQYNLQSQRLEAMRQQYAQLVAVQGADSRAAQEMEIRINRQIVSMNRLEAEVRQTNTQLRIQSSRWTQASAAMATASARMKAAGTAIASAGMMMTMYITAPIVAAGVASVKMASDTNESINKVEVAFKDSAYTVKAWAETTLKAYGIARGSSLDMAALFGDMATSMGFSTAEAAKMSTTLVGLAGDLSSFKNINLDEAKTALNAIFTGETESMKRLGVVMTEANLQEYALTKGINTKVNAMTQAEKVTLRYNYVLDKTQNSQGDFARTSDSTANQIRLFQESLKQLGDTIGQKLLPRITPMIKSLNDMIERFSKLKPETQETIMKFGLFAAAIGPVLLVVGKLVIGIGSLVGVIGTISGAIGTAGGLGAAMTAFATGPIGITLASIAGLTAGIILMRSELNTTTKAIDSYNTRNARFGGKYQINKSDVILQDNKKADDEEKAWMIQAAREKAQSKPATVLSKPSPKINTTTFNQAVKNYDYLEHMEKLNYSQQISYLNNILKKYASTTEEKRKIEMMLFDLKKNHASQLEKNEKKQLTAAQKKFNAEVALYNSKAKAGKLTYDQEVKALNDIKKKYAKDAQDKAKIDAMLFSLKKNHEAQLQKQKEENLKKQQVAYDNQLTAIEKIQKLFEKNKEDKANKEHIAYLQDRINRASDPMERASLQNELNKFNNDVSEKNASNVFDALREKVSGLKDNLGKTTAQISAQAKLSAAAMADVYKMMAANGINMNGSVTVATAAPTTNIYQVTIDAKNVKEFNDVVTIVKKLPTAAKKNVR